MKIILFFGEGEDRMILRLKLYFFFGEGEDRMILR